MLFFVFSGEVVADGPVARPFFVPGNSKKEHLFMEKILSFFKVKEKGSSV